MTFTAAPRRNWASFIRVLVAGFVLSAVAHPARCADEAPRLTLRWTTASEVDNAGFYVFRSEQKDGDFKQLNEKMLPGAGNAEVPSKYVYVDLDVQDGKTYYYYIESVSLSGKHEKFSPVIDRTCCAKPGLTEPPESAPDE